MEKYVIHAHNKNTFFYSILLTYNLIWVCVVTITRLPHCMQVYIDNDNKEEKLKRTISQYPCCTPFNNQTITSWHVTHTYIMLYNNTIPLYIKDNMSHLLLQ